MTMGFGSLDSGPWTLDAAGPWTLDPGPWTPAQPPSAAVAIDSRSATAPRTNARRLFVGIFEVRVAVEAVFIESQQAAGLLEVEPAFAHRDLHGLPKLADQRVGVEL